MEGWNYVINFSLITHALDWWISKLTMSVPLGLFICSWPQSLLCRHHHSPNIAWHDNFYIIKCPGKIIFNLLRQNHKLELVNRILQYFFMQKQTKNTRKCYEFWKILWFGELRASPAAPWVVIRRPEGCSLSQGNGTMSLKWIMELMFVTALSQDQPTVLLQPWRRTRAKERETEERKTDGNWSVACLLLQDSVQVPVVSHSGSFTIFQIWLLHVKHWYFSCLLYFTFLFFTHIIKMTITSSNKLYCSFKMVWKIMKAMGIGWQR